MQDMLHSEYWSNHQDIYKESLHVLDKSTFIVCAMFAAGNPLYMKYADRLALSCARYKLPFCIYQVPAVHKSIHPRGQADLSFTKAQFIFSNMMRFPGKNILYVDVDIFFVGHPERIVQISNADYDFAIYNWSSDEHNEAYMPINRKIEVGNRHSDLYCFSHSIDFYCADQLICSGGVQFYRNAEAAKKILEYWQKFISLYPDYADDESLDYVYNNFILDAINVKAYWLDKAYLRLPWWPHIKPIIIHLGLPTSLRNCCIKEVDNRQRFYIEKCTKKMGALLFPRDCIIDTKEKVLLKIVNNQVAEGRPIRQEFWIYPENIGLE